MVVFSLGTLSAQNTPPPSDARSTPATTAKPTQVPPAAVSTRFSTDYPNTKATWSTTTTGYRSEYIDPNTKMYRANVYDANGNPVGMEKEIAKGEYPTTINTYYSTTFPNEQYRVWTRDENGKKVYFVARPNETIYFDDKGNYTRKNERTSEMK